MRHAQQFLFLATLMLGSVLREEADAQFVQQGRKLVGTGAVGGASQGVSVSLSSDGNTAIVGGSEDNSDAGAAWVFTRSGGVWSQQGNKLVGTGAQGSPVFQGQSVSLSADGNTAIVGGCDDNGGRGAAWVFSRSSGLWNQQGDKLIGTGAVGNAGQGCSVSLSGDGNTAIVGGYGDNSYVGAAWVYVQSATGMEVQAAEIPRQFNLRQNYPNPFNPSTTIRYGLPHRTHMIIAVYNSLGQQVATLVQGEKEAGYHEARFDGMGLSSGVYFYRLTAGSFVRTRKLLLLR